MKSRPFRLTAPAPSETDIHEAVADALNYCLKSPPAEWACYPAGIVQLSPAQAARMSRAGLKRGWPDIMILHGRLYGIELKTRTGTLSKTKIVRTPRGAPRELIGQDKMFPRLVTAGFRDIAICHSVVEVLDQCQRWGIPLQGRIAA